MAEVTLDLRGVPKAQAYAELKQHAEAVLEGISDEIAAMATMSCLLHNAFGHLWTGFYRVVEPGKLLRVDVPAPCRIRWSADEWKTAEDVRMEDTGLGLYVADLPTAVLPVKATVEFTFYWPDADKWEDKNYAVTVG